MKIFRKKQNFVVLRLSVLTLLCVVAVLACNTVPNDTIADQLIGTWSEVAPQANRYRLIFERNGSFNLVSVENGNVTTRNGSYTLLSEATIGLCERINDNSRDCAAVVVGPYSLANNVLTIGPIQNLTFDNPIVYVSEQAQLVKQ